MTDKQDKGREIPWLTLAYMVFVLVFAFGGLLWSLWLLFTDRELAALLTVLVTVSWSRLLAGRWY
ncbi:hypothetical protein [Cupriavidus necator]